MLAGSAMTEPLSPRKKTLLVGTAASIESPMVARQCTQFWITTIAVASNRLAQTQFLVRAFIIVQWVVPDTSTKRFGGIEILE